jgi:ATP-dependent RNA helicase SUPV3L1/SUV3
MSRNFVLDRPRVRAVLGPTNTGKTHLAIDRMLGHDSGIIGFPLRLLARENYDRMVARKGAAHVALITGEEKVVPPAARWFACTVEAMPLDRPAAFLAIDEIQLCADPDRGHIFTDRLLHARGLAETLFLGAETIAPLLRRLVPDAEIETRPRLSRLAYAGVARLGRLPPRSAIVAFSANEVYAIAETVRRKRGGCAVVMGRLSPRTRNAQVAMFQAKEVDFLVATDAIGMGLNMDVNHVAFASLSKFDGAKLRALDAAEIAQIAGRAGRGMRDGTFGTIGETDPIPAEQIEQVEAHRFDPLTSLVWRNSALDFRSVDSLAASLARPPGQRVLRRGSDALDHLTLLDLARDPSIRAQVIGEASVRLLWDVCCVPDFRKLGDETHSRFCARLFLALANPPHRLQTDWIARSLQELSRLDGDIDTLMQRLAGVRVWAYIASRPAWLADAPHWQACAREVEDALSDALHDRLTARFVDRRAAHLIMRLQQGESRFLAGVSPDGAVTVEGHSIGRISGFVFAPETGASGEAERAMLRAARRGIGQEVQRRIGRIEDAANTEFRLDAANRIRWCPDGLSPNDAENWAAIGRLRAGATIAQPHVDVVDSEFLDAQGRRRVAARLEAWVSNEVGDVFAPLWRARDRATAFPALRGLMHRLQEGLGIAPHDCAEATDGRHHRMLRTLGIRIGAFATHFPALLKPRAMQLRVQLRSAYLARPSPTLPKAEAVSGPAMPDLPPVDSLALGWLAAGPLLVRLDVAERLAADLARLSAGGSCAVPAHIASRLGCRAAHVPAALRGLGFRVTPGVEGALLFRPRRRRPNAVTQAAAQPTHPAFAGLQALKQ